MLGVDDLRAVGFVAGARDGLAVVIENNSWDAMMASREILERWLR